MNILWILAIAKNIKDWQDYPMNKNLSSLENVLTHIMNTSTHGEIARVNIVFSISSKEYLTLFSTEKRVQKIFQPTTDQQNYCIDNL